MPAFSGREVITCDTRYVDSAHPNNKDKSGIVYSVPFYDLTGKLKGSVSAIILTHVIEHLVPSNDYVILNDVYHFIIPKPNKIKENQPFIYTDTLSLDIVDYGVHWKLWISKPNKQFWQRRDVVLSKQFAWLGYGVTLLLTASLAVGLYLVHRNQLHLELLNQKLLFQQRLLEHSQDQIKKFSGKILMVREDEKKRFASDLHDITGAMAVWLNSGLTLSKIALEGKNIQDSFKYLEETKNTLNHFIQELKKLAIRLRPTNLDAIGLVASLQEYFYEINKLISVKIKFNANIEDEKLSSDASIALYRVAQEVLSNVIKHANAKNVILDLSSDNNYIKFTIEDDGVGFEYDLYNIHSNTVRMGIIGMQERIATLNGSFKLTSQVGKGTKIEIIIPLGLL